MKPSIFAGIVKRIARFRKNGATRGAVQTEVEYRFIPIEKDMIPYRFDIALNQRTYTLQINYNAGHDFFTVDLYRDDVLVFAGEKIVYGKLLFCCQQYADVPDVIIIPYDLSLNAQRITWDNFGRQIFLWMPYVDDTADTFSTSLMEHYLAGGNYYG